MLVDVEGRCQSVVDEGSPWCGEGRYDRPACWERVQSSGDAQPGLSRFWRPASQSPLRATGERGTGSFCCGFPGRTVAGGARAGETGRRSSCLLRLLSVGPCSLPRGHLCEIGLLTWFCSWRSCTRALKPYFSVIYEGPVHRRTGFRCGRLPFVGRT